MKYEICFIRFLSHLSFIRDINLALNKLWTSYSATYHSVDILNCFPVTIIYDKITMMNDQNAPSVCGITYT